MAPDFDVFGLGQCSLDYIGIFDAYPAPDTKHEFQDLIVQGGGPVATAMVALSRWGQRCFFCGVVGDDDLGKRIRASLETEGVDTGGLLIRSGEGSKFAFIIAEPATGRRTILWRRPTGKAIEPGEIDRAMIERSRLFYTDGLFIAASLHAASIARKAGVPVMVDAGTLRDGMLELAALADFFIVSETFSRTLTGEDGPIETCRRLAALGPRLTGVTLGPKGYIALCREEVLQAPAHRVAVVDTTGCGDVFHAGVAYGLLRGWEARRCLDLANWAAACVSTQPGGRSGIPEMV
ncbi:MAG TPA: PfkB family carbohydrate kinase [Syntrophales bacterium]|nr:PfkB family carbohydrate kinase [Syntrophales bacterium]HPC31765.1 PfkB family carbohydrate kinase [Syntrophales bacterium]HQJ29739.1 PfkB family carbohydrate kinase [Syntrophales bacterium]HRR47475.1 PfkB family carbohydrate kinase [Syntrophales bacterium]